MKESFEIKKSCKLIKKEAEDDMSLVKKAKEGDKLAQDKLFQKNVNLIWHIINKVNTNLSVQSGIDKNDLFQIGAIGLIKALKNFQMDRSVKFSTFAFTYILGEIKMFLREDGLIKISREIKTNSMVINKLKDEYDKNNKELKINEIEKITGIKKEDIILAINSRKQAMSMDSACESENDGDMQNNLIKSLKSNDNVEEQTVRKIFLKELLKKLSMEERLIITERYLRESRQEEISKRLNITQVKVSRIEKRALEKLRLLVS